LLYLSDLICRPSFDVLSNVWLQHAKTSLQQRRIQYRNREHADAAPAAAFSAGNGA